MIVSVGGSWRDDVSLSRLVCRLRNERVQRVLAQIEMELLEFNEEFEEDVGEVLVGEQGARIEF